MNYAQPKERGGTLARILNSFLDGDGTVVNSSIFTGKTDTDTFREQIRKHWAMHKGTPKAYFNMWSRILAAFAAEVSPGRYLKREVIAYVDSNRQEFRDALRGIIPLADINDFLDHHLEEACDEAGLM